MKKVIVTVFVIVAFCIFVSLSDSITVGAQKMADEKTPRPTDHELASSIRKLTEHSASELSEKELSSGAILTDLGGDYQNVMLSQLDYDGEPISACVTNIDEANAFFGRNLETGESMPRGDFGIEKLSTIAARHGMDEQEFLYYSKMAAEAFQQQIAMSPQTATITIQNNDGAGEGFNDPAGRVAEGGNGGTTLGQQRLNVFNQAATIWGTFLDSAVATQVAGQFNSIPGCTPGGGVLGSAGATFTAANFANAEFTTTDYAIALANKQAGSDLVPANAEITTTFNSDVDAACLGPGTRFYYGFDNSTPAGTINLLVVALHELGHGLGFASNARTLNVLNATNATPILITTSSNHGLVSGESIAVENVAGNTAANGTRTVTVVSPTTFQLNGSVGNGAYTANTGRIRGLFTTGRPDIWSRFMFDQSTGLFWNAMNTAQRSASGINTNNLLWDGPSVRLGSGSLSAGRDVVTGRVQLFSPNPFQQGSSVSHWTTAATPNLLMEPAINVGLPLDLDLTRQLMRDIGWYRDTTPDTVADTVTSVTPNSGFVIINNNATINWTNTGGFTRNVTIEVSRNGGTTFTAIATDIANTGSFSWTVTGPSTTQARIRVREANFAAPSGVSSANFTVSLAPSAGTVSVSGRVTTVDGRSVAGAVVTLTSDTGLIFSARSNVFGYYRLEGLPVGRTYIATVTAKGLEFDPVTLNLTDNLSGLDFSAR
jgi:hypothetical protein